MMRKDSIRCPYTRPFDNDPASTADVLRWAIIFGLPIMFLMAALGAFA